MGDAETAQHKIKNRLALATTRGIKIQMPPHLADRTFAPPKFGDFERLIMLGISVLQKFWGATFAAARGRDCTVEIIENIQKIPLFAEGVEHHEIGKKIILQVI